MQRDRRLTSLTLSSLDERLVPAVVLDAAAVGAEVTAGDAIIRQTDAQPTGTGHIHSFVRFQGAASGGGSERGYNTTARPLEFDENTSPSFTRELTVGAVPRREIGGVPYREFLLDVNQKSSAAKISLDQVQVFLADAPDLTGYVASDPAKEGRASLGGKDAVFDLDKAAGGEGVSVVVDARLNAGSGAGDILLYVPEAAFVGATAETFVYLYSEMGGQAGATANGGFEEWAVKGDGGGAPPAGEPLSSLSGVAFVDLDLSRTYSEGDIGIPHAVIELRGTDYLGRSVVHTTETDETGAYSFANLLRGTYTLFEYDPVGYEDYGDVNEVGTINGIHMGSLGQTLADMDKILAINLAAGVHGINYNFGEYSDDGEE